MYGSLQSEPLFSTALAFANSPKNKQVLQSSANCYSENPESPLTGVHSGPVPKWRLTLTWG